jgi:hypothetical protein
MPAEAHLLPSWLATGKARAGRWRFGWGAAGARDGVACHEPLSGLTTERLWVHPPPRNATPICALPADVNPFSPYGAVNCTLTVSVCTSGQGCTNTSTGFTVSVSARAGATRLRHMVAGLRRAAMPVSVPSTQRPILADPAVLWPCCMCARRSSWPALADPRGPSAATMLSQPPPLPGVINGGPLAASGPYPAVVTLDATGSQCDAVPCNYTVSTTPGAVLLHEAVVAGQRMRLFPCCQLDMLLG